MQDRLLALFGVPLSVGFLLSEGGCHVTGRYVLSPAQQVQLAQVPESEAAQTALQVVRLKDQRRVYLRADLARAAGSASAAGPASQPSPGDPALLGSVVTTRIYSPTVTAGVVLTVLGSVMSVAGTIAHFTTSGDASLASGIVALAGEPPMIVGSVLWVLGLARPPQELRPGRPEIRYLDEPKLVPPVPPSPVPPPAFGLSARF